MKVRITQLFAFILSLSITPAGAVSYAETPHYDVVAEYVRSFGAIHGIQRAATLELEQDSQGENPSVAKLMTGIRSGTRTILELRSSIGALEQMSLGKPFETLLPTTIEFYKKKLDLRQESIDITKSVLEATDLNTVKAAAGRLPEITAKIEYIDESLFQMMPLVFGLLIDMTPDSKGHMSRLAITRAQKRTLIERIDSSFGNSLNAEKKNWTVSTASLLKAYLLKDYTCKDAYSDDSGHLFRRKAAT